MGAGRVWVSASLWSADLAALGHDTRRVDPHCDSFHFDVMDGHYVPNLLFGPDQVQRIRAFTRRPFEIHLMVEHPEQVADLFLASGDVFIVHRETCREWPALRRRLRRHGKRTGLALRVEEDWRGLEGELPDLDVVLVMGTPIGAKGLSIEPTVYRKIGELRAHLRARGLAGVRIQADGGIRRETIPLLVAAGADAVTAGSLLFQQEPRRFRAWTQALQPKETSR
jgi:ribulose-phosphate 3-epimerase